MNRKGLYEQIAIIVILGIILTVIILGYFVWSLFAPVISSTGGTLIGNLQTATAQTGDANITNSASMPLQMATSALYPFEWIGYITLFALFFGFLLMCFYVRTYPFLIIFWIAIILILIVLGIFFQSAYIDTANSSLSSSYSAWSVNDFLMRHFTTTIMGIGVLGGIILLLLMSKDSEAEASGL